MNLPIILSDLVKYQNNFDSTGYANCFTETAVVFDEGKTYNGKREIENWIKKANEDYQVKMKPLEYSETEQTLKAEISGIFPGSPAVLTYYCEFKNELIKSLKII